MLIKSYEQEVSGHCGTWQDILDLEGRTESLQRFGNHAGNLIQIRGQIIACLTPTNKKET